MRIHFRTMALLLVVLPLWQTVSAQHAGHHDHHPAAGPGDDSAVPLFDNLGTHHVEISTSSELAQQYFDQGVRLTYGFNHEEAIRAFREAARIDSTCAMCYWGIAYASGPNINAAMDSASGVEAYAAAQLAQRLAPLASPVEQALIGAVADGL